MDKEEEQTNPLVSGFDEPVTPVLQDADYDRLNPKFDILFGPYMNRSVLIHADMVVGTSGKIYKSRYHSREAIARLKVNVVDDQLLGEEQDTTPISELDAPFEGAVLRKSNPLNEDPGKERRHFEKMAMMLYSSRHPVVEGLHYSHCVDLVKAMVRQEQEGLDYEA